MIDPKWTKGEWRLSGPDDFGDYAVQGPDDELAIAAVVNGAMRSLGGHDEEHKANAHLITAAPDLYEALMAAESLAHRKPGPGALDEIREVQRLRRAALAKARGES